MDTIVNLDNVKRRIVLSRCVDGAPHTFRAKRNGAYYCQKCLLLALIDEHAENSNIYKLIRATFRE